jgi:hypothetical protein
MKREARSKVTLPIYFNFDKCVVQRTIHNFYAQEGTVPAIAKLLAKLKKGIHFKGGC